MSWLGGWNHAETSKSTIWERFLVISLAVPVVRDVVEFVIELHRRI